MSTDCSELVTLERYDCVAVLSLNHPSSLNSLMPGMLLDLAAKLSVCEDDDQIRVIVLTGSGKGFCSGANLSGTGLLDAGCTIESSIRLELNTTIMRLRKSHKPIIAAVNGPAAGAGVGLALACDMCIVASSARFILSFAKIGAVLDAGTSFFLQKALSPGQASWLAMTGSTLSAEQAVQWGLAQQLFQQNDFLNSAIQVAQQISFCAPSSISTIKWMLRKTLELPLSDALEMEAQCQGLAFQTDNFSEGVRAFQTGTQPEFTNLNAGQIAAAMTERMGQ